MRDGTRLRAVFLLPEVAERDSAWDNAWEPATDIYRIPGGWLLKFELAGVRLEDVAVNIEGDTVTVTGVRRDRIAEERQWPYSMEIRYARFIRTVVLPEPIQASAIGLEMRDGFLRVRLTEGNS